MIYNMNSDQILAEWDRIFPERKDNYGILNLDFSIWFPYRNQDAVTFKIGLINNSISDDEDTEDDSKYLYNDTVLNHRYPNKGTLTLSKQSGRKICKTGYPICAPIEEINDYKMLIIQMGIRDEIGTLAFPINVQLSKEAPIGGLDLVLHDWEYPNDEEKSRKMGFDFHTYESVFNKSDGTCYGISQSYILGEPHRGIHEEKEITLNAIPTGRKDLVVVMPKIDIKGQFMNESIFI